MSRRTSSILAWSLWVLALALAAGSYWLIAITETTGDPTRFSVQGFDGGLTVLFATVGLLLASRRPENPIGWIFLGSGVAAGIQGLGAEYGTYGHYEGHGPPMLGHIAAWIPGWLWMIAMGPVITFVLLLFPNGRLRSPRWRVVAWASAVSIAAGVVGFMLMPRVPGDFDVGNPFGLESRMPWELIGFAGAMGLIACAIASAVSVALRFRDARAEERAQLKWLAFFGLIATVVLGVFGPGWWDPGETLVALCVAMLPVAIAIAVLRYRLYDIDIVINKAVVYGALAGFIGLVYVGVVVGIGAAIGGGSDEPNVGLSILATAIVALAFNPVRQRLQHVANRLVYGKRATPYEVLSEFADHVGGTYSTEDVLPRTARVVAEGIGAARVDIWLRLGSELRVAASWPPGTEPHATVPIRDGALPPLPGDAAFPVRHRGELLGALAVVKSRGETITPAEEKLLTDLASQAGLILRNVRLTEELRANLEELRASRQRIVAAQDDERRRLERNIHDGAQQQLVALAVKLRLTENLLERDPAKAREMLAGLHAETAGALDTLRDLARGIYPPLLADQGLVAALQAQARKSAVPVDVVADGDVGRYSQDVEAAVYFCVLEALQNVAKSAQASSAIVRLSTTDGSLDFTVSDDGIGFDPKVAPRGSGLQNMADRLAALDGRLDVTSAPGRGTIVAGRVPVHTEAMAP